MDLEREVDRILTDYDECPHCNGMGKLSKPGAPDCHYCRGTGVMESFPYGDLPKEEKGSPKPRLTAFRS